MSGEVSSYRSILKSTGLIGSASIGVLLINMGRAKAFALLVGPAGIGILGLLSTIVVTASAIAGMGLNSSAVRELAQPDADQRAVRRAVWSLAALLALAGTALVWLMRSPLSYAIDGSGRFSDEIGWSALAVGLTVIAATQGAIFQGLRRIADLARMNLAGTLIGALLSIAAVYQWREVGVVASVVIMPAAVALTGAFLASRLPKPNGQRPSTAVLRRHWGVLLKLGTSVAAAAILGTIAQLALRALVLRELGLDGVGLFQAGLAISAMNVGLVLTAMAADYYPRLSQVADDPSKLGSLLDQQLQIALLLSAPVLLALSAGAGWWLHLLYSGEFVPAADLLRWQISGEAMRLPVWAAGFVLLARRDRRAYVLQEAAFGTVALTAAWLLLPQLGLVGAGVAHAIGYAASFIMTIWLVARCHSVRMSAWTLAAVLLLFGAAVLLAVTGGPYPMLAAVAGFAASAAAGLWAAVHLRRIGALPAIGIRRT